MIVFIGAVRDIQPNEHHLMNSICKTYGIPLLPCHLGYVPEFTSKIVTAVKHHYSFGRLHGAVAMLYKQHQIQQKKIEKNSSADDNTFNYDNNISNCNTSKSNVLELPKSMNSTILSSTIKSTLAVIRMPSCHPVHICYH